MASSALHNRMDRNSRVDSAKNWIVKYECKNNIKGYKKRFGVDWLCTIKELQILGVRFDPRYMEKLKLSVKNCIIEEGCLRE